MRRLLHTAIVGVVTAAAMSAPLAAQGALSVQGFGFPTGQLSTRAAGTAGAIGEMDATSPINPGALPSGGRTFFSFQVDPESRSVSVGGHKVNTNVVRFPVVAAGARVFTRGFVGASFSTLLDRTWDAAYNDTVLVAGEGVRSTVATSVRGAVNDTRVAFGWQFTERLQAGLAFHALSGANRLKISRTFTDSGTFGPLSQLSTLSYSGSAVSGGVVVLPLPHLFFAASGRIGGAMATRYGDSVVTRGHAPDRYGMSLLYDGIPGSQIAVRYSRDLWSRMRSLGSSSLAVNDAEELSAGLDVAGPKFQGIASQVRFGGRVRDLPFGWNGNAVKEKTTAVGGQLPLARGWASVDVSVQWSKRTAGPVTEHGTSFSVGLTVRP